jgi:hypothetical protein
LKLGGGIVVVQGDVDNAGEQACEIDDDPVARVRPDMCEPIASHEPLGFEHAGILKRGTDEPAPRVRVDGPVAPRHDGRPIECVGGTRAEQVDERCRHGGRE